MRVTIVLDIPITAHNGTTVAAINLVKTLQDRGHLVRVVTPDPSKKGQKGYYVMPTIDFGPLQTIVDHNEVALARGDERILEDAIRGADEVHIMMPLMVGRKALKIARSIGVPVSAGFHVQAENVTAHFFNFMDWPFANRCVYRNFDKRFFSMVDAIHYPTEFIRRTYEEAIGHTTPGYVISNGVSSLFHPQEGRRLPGTDGKFLIVCTGRYSKEKKQTLLIKAWSLSRHRNDIKVVFAGTGPRLEEMKRCARRHGVEPIYQQFERTELAKVLAASDLYVHTSEIEIEAISCLEAIASGLVPLINDSPRSATREFAIDFRCLFALNDAHDLAAKIDYWYEHPEERKKQAKDYAHYAERFAFDRCMEAMANMIKETAEKRK